MLNNKTIAISLFYNENQFLFGPHSIILIYIYTKRYDDMKPCKESNKADAQFISEATYNAKIHLIGWKKFTRGSTVG